MSYRFVPAATNALDKNGVGIYVKYTRSKTDEIIVKKDTYSYIWLQCPDRELVFVKHRFPEFSPMGENFDEYINLNIYDEDVTSEIRTDIYMLNYTAYSGSKTSSPRLRRSGRNPDIWQPHILADSGGFQLYSGVKEYLDPVEIVSWYNDNVDWGMVLDVPPALATPEIVKRSAKIQAKNIELMLKHKVKNLELINILQGITFEQRKGFLDIVDHPELDRLAFSGYRGTVVNSVADVLKILSLPRKFKHYHILGVYNLPKLIPIIKMANMGKRDFLITSDASTPIQSAVNKIYHHQQTIFEPAKRLLIGHKESISNPYYHLPCTCPVCSAVKYINIFGFIDTQLISNLLSIHNIYEINRYTRMMDKLASTVDAKEYRSVASHQLGTRAPDSLASLDLIDAYYDNPDKALKRYSLYFNKLDTGLFDSSGLFEDNVRGEDSSTVDKAIFVNKREETDAEKRERQERVLQNYEKLYFKNVKKKKERTNGNGTKIGNKEKRLISKKNVV